jgi:hypothetical protein
VRLTIAAEIPNSPFSHIDHRSLVRAGQVLVGPQKIHPATGWYSPTYNLKIPALSFALQVRSPRSLSFLSDWVLED